MIKKWGLWFIILYQLYYCCTLIILLCLLFLSKILFFLFKHSKLKSLIGLSPGPYPKQPYSCCSCLPCLTFWFSLLVLLVNPGEALIMIWSFLSTTSLGGNSWIICSLYCWFSCCFGCLRIIIHWVLKLNMVYYSIFCGCQYLYP